MPRQIPLNLVTQKNKTQQADPWIHLIHVHLIKLDDPGDTTDFFLCNNYEDVTFPPAGQVYTKFAFEIEARRSGSKGQLEQVSLKISNVARVLQPTLEEYDGGNNGTVTLTIVSTAHLGESYAALQLDFSILTVVSTNQFVVLKLGASNPLKQRHPLYKYSFGNCRYVSRYKGAECRAISSEAECDGTLNNCITRDNTKNFGGFPGMKQGAIQIAKR